MWVKNRLFSGAEIPPSRDLRRTCRVLESPLGKTRKMVRDSKELRDSRDCRGILPMKDPFRNDPGSYAIVEVQNYPKRPVCADLLVPDLSLSRKAELKGTN